MATRTISNAGGNWNAAGSWVEGAFPIAGDAVVATGTSGNLTVNVASACASLILTGYVGTLTFDSTLTLTSTPTFATGMTIAGTAGTLILNTGGYTITSAGKTLTCALTFGASNTYTLADNWTVTGLVTAGVTTGTTTLNGAFSLTCNGGFHQAGTTASVTGAAKLVMGGGTWDSASTGAVSNNIDLAGNVTVSGAIAWGLVGSKTLTYLSGTVTTTGSTLTIAAANTLNTAGVTWASLTMIGAVTYTNSSTLAWNGTFSMGNTAGQTWTGAGALNGTGSVSVSTGTLTLNNTGGLTTTGTLTHPNANVTFAGSAGYTVGTQTTATLTVSRTCTLTFGNTYRVTSALANVGASSTIRQAIVSSSAGNKVVFTLSPGATTTLTFCDPTDIDSSAGATVVSVGGTITTSLNWSGSVTAGTTGAGGVSFGLHGPLFSGREETMDVALDEVVYFDGIAALATGAANDADSTPSFAVYEEATDTDIGVGANMTKRTSLTGNYRGSFTCSAANGFELGKWYTVVGSATISTAPAKGILMRFRIVAAEVVAGYPLTDVAKILGTASTGAAGYVGVDWGQVANKTTTNALTGTTIATVTNQLTAAAIATAIFQDTTAGDFTVASSIGKSLYNAFTANTSVFTTAALANAPTSSAPTAAAVATAVWQDLLAGSDFDTADSIGAKLKLLDVDAVAGGVTLADGKNHGGTPGSSTATLALQQVRVVHPSGTPVRFQSTGGNGTALDLLANGSGRAIHGFSDTGDTIFLEVDSGGAGIRISGGGAGVIIGAFGGTSPALALIGPVGFSIGSTAGPAIDLLGAVGSPTVSIIHSTDSEAVRLESAGNHTLNIVCTAAGKHGIISTGGTDGDGLHLVGAGTGHDISLAGSGDIWNSVADTPVRVNTDRVMFSGVLGDQSAGDVLSVVLPTGPATNGVLAGSRLRVTSGLGQYEEKTIRVWDGGGKIASIDSAFAGGLPALGDSFKVLYDNSYQLDAAAGNVLATSQVSSFNLPALQQLFLQDSGKTYADAVAGSIVKEIAANAGSTAAAVSAQVLTDLALAHGAGSYIRNTEPDNASITAIKAKTDNLPADPAGLAGLTAAHGAGSWTTATGFAVAGDAMALTVGERGAVADKLLGRSLAGGADGGRTVQDALRAARNRVAFDVPVAGQFTVFLEDDQNPAWVGTYTRGAAGLGPLTSTDPT